MPSILALDTATEACSVALLYGDRLHERHAPAPRQHAEKVLPWIDELLAEAGIGKTQIDAIAVGRGPGGFTGVRLAVAVAQGLAFALDKPLLAVSTLAALAFEAGGQAGDHVLAALDARMGELYLGAFVIAADRLPQPIGGEWMAAPDQVEPPLPGPWIGVGSGFAAASAALVERLGARLTRFDAAALPRAGAIARLAARDWPQGGIAPAQLEPAYLRDKVAQTLAERGIG